MSLAYPTLTQNTSQLQQWNSIVVTSLSASIPEGYYNWDETISVNDSDIAAWNIKTWINILWVDGTFPWLIVPSTNPVSFIEQNIRNTSPNGTSSTQKIDSFALYDDWTNIYWLSQYTDSQTQTAIYRINKSTKVVTPLAVGSYWSAVSAYFNAWTIVVNVTISWPLDRNIVYTIATDTWSWFNTWHSTTWTLLYWTMSYLWYTLRWYLLYSSWWTNRFLSWFELY